jgi:hypothetical protein
VGVRNIRAVIERAGQAGQRTEDWFSGLGLHRSRGTVRCPGAASTVRKIIGKPCAGNRVHGFERRIGNRARKSTAPLTNNGSTDARESPYATGEARFDS